MTKKKPEADFVIRLVGDHIRPENVSVEALAKILNAVDRLINGDGVDGLRKKRVRLSLLGVGEDRPP